MGGARTHIFFSASAAGSLRQVLRVEGSDDEVVCLEDNLSYGPIGSLDPATRYEALVQEGLADEETWNWLPSSSRQFWSRCAASPHPRILWRSSRSPAEMAGYLAYMHRFGALPCDIIELEEATGALRRSNGEPWGVAYGLGELSADQLRLLRDWARPLAPDAAAAAGRLWERLVEEGAMLRIPDEGAMGSAPETLIDERFLQECSDEWQSTARVLGNLLGKLPEERGFALDLFFLEWRLGKLLSQGALESREESGSRSRFAKRAWLRRAPG